MTTATTTEVQNSTAQPMTVDVPTAALRAALDWVAPALAKDLSLPMLNGIHIHCGPKGSPGHPVHYHRDWSTSGPDGSAITLATTDRYRLHWATIDLPEQDVPEFTILVEGARLIQAAKSWPKAPARYPTDLEQVTIKVPGAGVWPTFSGRYFDAESSASIPEIDGQFPKFRDLIPTQFDDSLTANAVSSDYLGQLAAAAKRFDKCRGLQFRVNGMRPMPFFVDAPEPPVRVSAILMPVRIPS